MIPILYLTLLFLPLIGSIAIDPLILIINSKEPVALIACFAIFFTSLKNCPDIRTTKIEHVSLVLLFIFISNYYSPPIELMLGYENLGGLWQWKSFAICMFYYLLYISLTFYLLKKEIPVKTSKAICLSSIISSIYVFIQFLKLDQFQAVKSIEQIGSPQAQNITAMIGNPTILGVWLCSTLPFLWFFSSKRMFYMCILAILLTRSATAIAGVFLISYLLWVFQSKFKRFAKTVTLVCVFFALILGLFAGKSELFSNNGRFGLWREIVLSLKTPPIQMEITPEMSFSQRNEAFKLSQKNYLLTGRGLGSFPIFFNMRKETTYAATLWGSAHNEYLETFYCLGLIGFLLIIYNILNVLIKSFIILKRNTTSSYINFYVCCYISFFYLMLASFLNPLWHLEPTRFYIAVLFCFLSRLL